MNKLEIIFAVVLGCCLVMISCGDRENVIFEADTAEDVAQLDNFGPASHTYQLAGPLVPRHTTMVTAWDIPRNHIGGNCYSEIDKKTNIEYHKYGTHIFHTSIKPVWNYIKDFTEFNNYRHQDLTKYNYIPFT